MPRKRNGHGYSVTQMTLISWEWWGDSTQKREEGTGIVVSGAQEQAGSILGFEPRKSNFNLRWTFPFPFSN